MTIPLKCAHCGRPIGGLPTYISGFAYHFECTRSPYANNYFGQPPTFGPLPPQPADDSWLKSLVDKFKKLGE